MNKTECNRRVQTLEKLYIVKQEQCRQANRALASAANDAVRLTRELAYAKLPWYRRWWRRLRKDKA